MNEEAPPHSPQWWDARYRQGNTPWDRGVVAPEIERFAREYPGHGAWALDIGCGTGVHSRELCRHGYRVIGIDLAHTALERALAAARAEELPWWGVQASADDIPVRGRFFTVAIDIGCFHALSEAQQHAYATGLARILLPGAAFLLYAVRPRRLQDVSGPPGVAPEQIRDVLKPAFREEWRQQGWQGERRADWWLWKRRS
ncbi:MAG: class I SAM-dependent methyltransferase [Caldilineae bacterium]|nr:MAG: class I SAM-dependent methyltransferase [Caldilineae bacterium]